MQWCKRRLKVIEKGLETEDNTLKAIAKIGEDVSQLLQKLLRRKSAPACIVRKAEDTLSMLEKGSVIDNWVSLSTNTWLGIHYVDEHFIREPRLPQYL